MHCHFIIHDDEQKSERRRKCVQYVHKEMIVGATGDDDGSKTGT